MRAIAVANQKGGSGKTTTTVTTQTTKTIQNADGTYTIIQYPADKEVTVSLTPGATMTSAKGLARVMRHGDATTIGLLRAGGGSS